MLELAAKQKIEPWIQKRNMDDVNEVIPKMHKGDVRYRYVLVNEKNGGEL
jgi:alcohol dehydrogenase (NADP+)